MQFEHLLRLVRISKSQLSLINYLTTRTTKLKYHYISFNKRFFHPEGTSLLNRFDYWNDRALIVE